MTVLQAAKGKFNGAGLRDGARIGGQCRALWNLFVAENAARFKADGKFVFYAEMSARLPRLLKEDARLAGLPLRAAQMTVQRLDCALRDCAKSKGKARWGFPRYKRRFDRNDSFSFVGRAVRLEPGRVRLPQIGWLRVRRLAIPEGADLNYVALTQKPDGWHVSIQFAAPAKAYATPTLPPVGLDAGLNALVVLSDGREIAHPRLAQKAAKRIRRLDRERDRRRKGSMNRRRTVARLALAHRAVANARRDDVHTITRELVDTYKGFVVQDLRLHGLMRPRMAGFLADAGLGEMLRILRDEAKRAGGSWRVHGRFALSTDVCPDCGRVGGCRVVHDRNVAAARVIFGDARVTQAAPGRASAAQAGRRDPAKAKPCCAGRGPGIRPGQS